MEEPVGVYISGAVLPRCAVGGRVQPGLRWRVGSLAVGRGHIDWRTRSESSQIPLSTVVGVTGSTFSLLPPPLPFDQCLLVHHLGADNVPVVTALGFPSITVGNFPLQLSAALVGTIRAQVVTATASGATSEDAYFTFDREAFHIRRPGRDQVIPVKDVASVSMHRGRIPDGRESLEWTLDYVVGDHVSRMSFSSTERLQFLIPFMSVVQALRRNASLPQGVSVDSLSETTQQVAMMLYNGNVRASSVEQMLGLAPDAVDKVYEELLAHGFASVVKTRKEIQLTPAGTTLVAAIIKRQMEIPGA